ncbi:MAG: PepSY-associated TM helix domain-containing protein [Nitrospira sp.]
MHHFFLLLHRWIGLILAGFLIMSGLTGAVISWDHELDELLNPQLTRAKSQGPPLPVLGLATAIEARDKRAQVTFIPLAIEPGDSLAFGIDPIVDPATGRLYELDYNQVFIDPTTGQELGRREWGAVWPVTKETIVSFLYKFHYSLHIPEMWGIDQWGLWLMGGIAILWALDCFVGFYLTLPSKISHSLAPSYPKWWVRWKPSWMVRLSSTERRINFDIHRAFGLWTWGLLFMLAFTAFSLNLYREMFYPIMSLMTEVTPSPFDERTPNDKHRPIVPTVGYAAILEHAQQEAATRNWSEPLGDVFYSQEFGIYGVRFFQPGDDHGAAGVGPPALYFDGSDGRYLGESQPWKGTMADIFVQAQFPLHSGRILGLPGRILVSIMGLGTAMLSITGVVIWWGKHVAYQRRERHRMKPLAPLSVE